MSARFHSGNRRAAIGLLEIGAKRSSEKSPDRRSCDRRRRCVAANSSHPEGLEADRGDYSGTLPPAPKHIKLRPNVDMEDLPFGDSSISGFVSRFGIEYGGLERVAAEVERALAPGGVFAFVIHHCDSPIHAINKARAEQLSWALEDQEIIAKADAYLRSRQLLGNVVPPGFQTIANLAFQNFGQYSVATEFAHAVLQTLTIGIDKPVEVCRSIISQLNNQSTQEIKRIRAMVTA